MPLRVGLEGVKTIWGVFRIITQNHSEHTESVKNIIGVDVEVLVCAEMGRKDLYVGLLCLAMV
jgi:hypothetical protein